MDVKDIDESPLINISNVTVYRQQEVVLENFSLQVAAGECVAVLGPNGAGKSTLLKLITRELYPVVKPDSYIRLDGSETINLWQLRSRIGMVSQDFQIDYTPYTTGIEVVLSGFFGAVGQHDHLQVNAEQRRRAEQVMAQLAVCGLADTMYQRLSTGQQRRLLLARAMVHNPQLYILDEPSAGLDLAGAHQLLRSVREACTQHCGLLLATHHIDEIVPEVTRVVLLKEGRIIADGDKAAVLTSAQLSELYGVDVSVTEQDGWYRARCID